MTIASTLSFTMTTKAAPAPKTPTIRPSTPSGASPFADLPHELMAEVFLHLDPHTLYTSIRFLNSNWKETVESHIIPMLFNTEKWRVALRVHRRPRKETIYGPESEEARRIRVEATHESEEARRIRVEATPGAWEDELLPPPEDEQEIPEIKQHIPLHFQQMDPVNNRFHFSTGNQWYALYELTPEDRSPDLLAGRLRADFGLVWRFDGDGQEELDSGNGSWGKLDQENGWLSKFYCSSYDTSSRKLPYPPLEPSSTPVILNTTRLARRRRMPAGPPDQGRTSAPLYWDDKHIEYLHLDLSLGSEFFVRRSARANLLMRALEAEAARRDNSEAKVSIKESENKPILPQSQPVLHRPAALRSHPSPANAHGHLKSGSNGHTKVRDGLSTPPRSALNYQLSPNMSPAEQLQMIARSKAAAKAAGRRRDPPSSRPSSRPPSRAVSQPVSLASSQVTSCAPSRAPSRGPTRPSSPVQAADSSEELTAALSTMASPAVPGTPLASPRDLPFFRASALALSTNSPYTREALSGYITPDPNASLGLNRSRIGPFGMPSNAFSLRGGGGAQPGGTPIAEFKARIRRAGGFEALDLAAIARQETRGDDGEGALEEAEGTTENSSSSVWRRGADIRDGQARESRRARLLEPEEGSYEGDPEMLWSWSR